MRRPAVVLVLLVCFQLCTPAPAHAFLRWIWELSGPGPFLGVPDIQWRLVCFGKDDGSQAYDVSGRITRNKQKAAALLGAGCLTRPGFIPTVSLNVETGFGWQLKNHLEYESGVNSRVYLTVIEPTITFNVDPNRKRDAIEIGFGAGAYIMNGPAFPAFTQAFYEPLRADFRPFPGRWRAFAVKTGVIVIPDGLTDKDFGAKPGTFSSETEVRPVLGVTFDLLQWLQPQNSK